MASWHVTRIDFTERISERRVRALRQELQNLDRDFGTPSKEDPSVVDVYGDGIRGMWRSPMVFNPVLRELLKKRGIPTGTWIFEPRHCGDELECDCHKLGATYGCVRAEVP